MYGAVYIKASRSAGFVWFELYGFLYGFECGRAARPGRYYGVPFLRAAPGRGIKILGKDRSKLIGGAERYHFFSVCEAGPLRRAEKKK